ncbi:short-chain dehydrogenase [Neptunitalea chrysea]|uniref:Short-chain dehydrogenase n=1 Tax=Neptunitalea chrysea TaxID=1647581 RepID=A0A9W6ETX7_9FLAO|nr:SDR family NAD(P)-dependent oxidoreductase [Neptunitalea chrysea]GLB52730.1 short-chain dehydrogenase [Neptunitalea chrysea]
MTKKKIALITGATSGIGKATAELFAKNGIDLVLCGRRTDRLKELETVLSEQVSVYTLAFDVSNKEEVKKAIDSIPKDFTDIDILINNAGNAHGLDPIQTGSLDDWDAMIDINVKGLLYVSKAIIPGMIDRGVGHIINIGSIAGKEVYPNGNVYCATKHAVNALNKAMRIDLYGKNIRVGAVHPGLVETEFSEVRFKGDTEKAKNVYQGFEPLTGHDIADVIHFVVTRPYHINISDLLILPTAQVTATMTFKA